MDRSEILIAGAGPTGLVLALWLVKSGVKVRIVDKAEGPGTTSRALAFHARNLELYHQMGIDRLVIDGNKEFREVNIWIRGSKVATVNFGDTHEDISPYLYSIIYPQDRHEQMLVDQLAKLGVQVERSTSLVSYQKGADKISVTTEKNGQQQTTEVKYLCGCDGARSVVREGMGVDFPGGTYSSLFYVADIHGSGPTADGGLHISLDDSDFLAVFPMLGEGNMRLVGTVKQKDDDHLKWEDIDQRALERVRLKEDKVNWFSTYRVHHRVAGHFQQGRVFLLGDAAHIHSPVGGQGMNTGIGDAVNLAWKLAAVLKGSSAATILDSYEPERIAFARRLVETTDNAFKIVTADSRLAAAIRVRVPRVLTYLSHYAFMRRFLYRTLSQTSIHYPDSPLSEGSAGGIKGGDRLPWVKDAAGDQDNYGPLTTMQWQVHCYGSIDAALKAWCDAHKLEVVTFAYSGTADHAGYKKDTAYLVRPDGYVALAGADVKSLAEYVQRWGIVAG
jgi:2-polyprenyl-6-methoxyphenol hydroxylase-like FAD-dependent oxidoreductase